MLRRFIRLGHFQEFKFQLIARFQGLIGSLFLKASPIMLFMCLPAFLKMIQCLLNFTMLGNLSRGVVRILDFFSMLRRLGINEGGCGHLPPSGYTVEFNFY